MAVGDIPSDYTDLLIKVSLRNNRAAAFSETVINFNGSGTGYSVRYLGGDGSSAFSGTGTNGFFAVANGNTTTANTFANQEIYIPNYRSSVAKSFSADSVAENNATAGQQYIIAGLWTGTDPITSITISSPSYTLLEHTSASLFGITAGSDGIVAVS